LGPLSDVLERCALIAIDTAPFIYLFEEHPQFLPVSDSVISRCDNPDDPLEAITSVITVTEVIVHPLQLGQKHVAEAYEHRLMNQRGLTVLPVDTEIAVRAADLRARYRFAVPDAIQLATAIEASADLFVTNDSQLRRVTEIPVAVLSDYLPHDS
jgi:predicted nucleic acid-binding protein